MPTLRAGWPGFESWHRVYADSGAHQSRIQWSFILTGAKSLRREPEHSPPPSAEVKNVWSYTSTPPYVFMVWCLIKHQGQRYLTNGNENGAEFWGLANRMVRWLILFLVT
jgi:hypothetical protein